MKKLLINVLFTFTLIGIFSACGEDEFQILETQVPSANDINISFDYDSTNPNLVNFSSDSEGFIFKWAFGTGATGEGKSVQGAFPLKGDYWVKLTIFTAGGSAIDSVSVNIPETNFAMLETPDLINLTGGVDQIAGKSWVIDAGNSGHFGLGPISGSSPEWYQAAANEKADQGMYDDVYTFNLNGFAFGLENNGTAFSLGSLAGDHGGDPANGDQLVNYVAPNNISWSLSEGSDKRKFLTLSDGAFIGTYTGVSTYEVLTLEENEIFLKGADASNGEFAWYHRLIPEGYVPPVAAQASFTHVLEGSTVTFTNTSETALSYSWNFGDGNTSSDLNPSHTYGADGVYTITLTATDENGSTTATASVIVATTPMTFADLTGDGTKSWKLRPSAGSFGVGPYPGSVEWYPGGADLSGERPCLFNDEYHFKTSGEYIYLAKGDTFVESYFGLDLGDDGCYDEYNLFNTPADVWSSNKHTFTFEDATDSTPAKIIVSGTGAYIGLAKANDAGELTEPPTTSGTATYEILYYVKDGDKDIMAIGIHVGNGVWWNYVLISE